MKWQVLEVLQEGSLTGVAAGRTHKLIIQFPWGVEEREFAPTHTEEDIRNTIESIIEHRDDKIETPKDIAQKLRTLKG